MNRAFLRKTTKTLHLGVDILCFLALPGRYAGDACGVFLRSLDIAPRFLDETGRFLFDSVNVSTSGVATGASTKPTAAASEEQREEEYTRTCSSFD